MWEQNDRVLIIRLDTGFLARTIFCGVKHEYASVTLEEVIMRVRNVWPQLTDRTGKIS